MCVHDKTSPHEEPHGRHQNLHPAHYDAAEKKVQ